MNTCWCGNTTLLPFGPDYGRCDVCGTLVSVKGIAPEQTEVHNDEIDFYGKHYWLTHQKEDFGFPDIHNRARTDLTERNLHWLKVLLKYRLPPASVLELGCSHGSFVALLRQAGFEASGVEMSPWVVAFGQETFGVPIHTGPIESLDIASASLDVVALMDVLEHLPKPMATMRRCLELLKPTGLLFIQTPQFKETMHYETLVNKKSPFLNQLKSEEHLYLFGKRAITELFKRVNTGYIHYEPAIFAHYDMFFVVSRAPFKPYSSKEIESALLSAPNARFALALLDLRGRELDLINHLKESEADRAARFAQIETLTTMLRESEADRAARFAQIETLTTMLRESEADRAARFEQIETLTAILRKSETDRAALFKQIETLTAMFQESDSDRGARFEQIEALTALLRKSETERAALFKQIEALTALFQESDSDRGARFEQIEMLTALLRESEADRAARGEQITMILSDLRALFSRSGFRWTTKFANWPEAKKLAEHLGNRDE